MIGKLLYWYSGKLKVRVINDGDGPYLERYYVGTVLNKRFYLHRFMASDPDRGVHNHPWKWAISFILTGRYKELLLEKLPGNDWAWTERFRTKKGPSLNFIDGKTQHRVLLDNEYFGKTWTLFMHGPRASDWGFTTYSKFPSNECYDLEYTNVVNAKERAKNAEWWKRPDCLTGNQIR